MEIENTDNLEKALDNQPKISKDEEIGFHKGALNTLIAERNELIKIVNNVDMIIQAHLAKLKELGVEIDGR